MKNLKLRPPCNHWKINSNYQTMKINKLFQKIYKTKETPLDQLGKISAKCLTELKTEMHKLNKPSTWKP